MGVEHDRRDVGRAGLDEVDRRRTSEHGAAVPSDADDVDGEDDDDAGGGVERRERRAACQR